MDEPELKQLIQKGVGRWSGPNPHPASAGYSRRARRRPLVAVTAGAAAAGALLTILVAGVAGPSLQHFFFTPAAETQQSSEPGMGANQAAPLNHQEPGPAVGHEPSPSPKHEPPLAPKHEPSPSPKHEPAPTPCDCTPGTPSPSPAAR